MNDMRAVIVPKSDQMNADDLIGGPITITITEVQIKPGEQPVSIFFEGDSGKPYRCCKSMAKVMVNCWGPDANNYIGRSMTLYRDPKVKWGGMEVGGIRISHMSDIAAAQTMALTETRGNKKLFTVKPLVVQKPEPVKAAAASPSKDRKIADRIAERLRAANDSAAYNEIMMPGTALQDAWAALPNDMKAELETIRSDALDRIASIDPAAHAPVTHDEMGEAA